MADLSDEERLARQFHEAYERLAPTMGYGTRLDTRVFDPHSTQGRTMIAVCREILATQRSCAHQGPYREALEGMLSHPFVTRDSVVRLLAYADGHANHPVGDVSEPTARERQLEEALRALRSHEATHDNPISFCSGCRKVIRALLTPASRGTS